MTILTAVLITAAAASVPQPIDKPDWIRSADYPPWDRETLEGVVEVKLLVDATGMTTGCGVTISSGNVKLDEYTCSLLMKRARFEPARGLHGKRVPGEVIQAVHWEVQRDQIGNQASIVRYNVERSGELSNCTVENHGADKEAFSCNEPLVHRITEFALGQPLERFDSVGLTLLARENGAVSEVISVPQEIAPAGAEKHVLSSALVETAANGKVVRCETISSGEGTGKALDMCSVGGPFEPVTRQFTADGREHKLIVEFSVFGVPR
ncbi:TonB family protein [Novosphingobium clariflavum]|uniref:TonB family protein n=1 Tax=Novosphingobium clariflavum TaxID=2029884 RepID=A0ABV6S3D3_9SPHN|nr:TonB family protein [Novosphingobium clariflavum]